MLNGVGIFFTEGTNMPDSKSFELIGLNILVYSSHIKRVSDSAATTVFPP